MRRLIYPLVAAGMLAIAPMALAETTTGIVEAVDPTTMTLTLADGTTFQLPADLAYIEVAPGAQVEVTWEMQDGQQVVTDVAIID
jgi:hypothetical protein